MNTQKNVTCTNKIIIIEFLCFSLLFFINKKNIYIFKSLDFNNHPIRGSQCTVAKLLAQQNILKYWGIQFQ